MSNFLDWLDNNIARKKQAVAEGFAETDSMLQALRNEQAPSISSSSGGFSGGSDPGAGNVGTGPYLGKDQFGNPRYGPPPGGYVSGTQVPARSIGPLPTMKGKVNPVAGRISQEWGASRIRYAAGRHTGMDFGAPMGTRVNAAAAGRVVRAGWEGAYGNSIAVRHADGTTTTYSHLSSIGVAPGQKVGAGGYLGKVGSTGRSSGAHLHFEVRKADRYGGDMNPRNWFSTR